MTFKDILQKIDTALQEKNQLGFTSATVQFVELAETGVRPTLQDLEVLREETLQAIIACGLAMIGTI